MTLVVTAVSGSLHAPGFTTVLLEGIVSRIARERDVDAEVVELSALARDIASALTGGERTAALELALERLGRSDLVVVGTPIYRGSYTGLFKSFFDLVHQDALEGVPVILAAGGGNDQHTLAIDHELRPLFAFFRALTAPVGIYARPGDYADGRIASDSLVTQIERAVEASLALVRGTVDA
ncbi:NAD(P)H-dependent oxidoreductase [Microbacterium sp. B2969]|uniref:NAD(P)H-dependent oxidoreductase n=1 Tax=Microbacterium alkaliflavum TaxID=3248839 RepID=A0ABW7QEK8_9MICO